MALNLRDFFEGPTKRIVAAFRYNEHPLTTNNFLSMTLHLNAPRLNGMSTLHGTGTGNGTRNGTKTNRF